MYSISDILQSADKIRFCTAEDIPIHYSIVAPLVHGTDKNEYQALMAQSVTEETAYTLLDNSCFLYYLKDEKYTAKGITFYGKDNPAGMLMLLIHIFSVIDPTAVLLRFSPHMADEIQTYKSLLLPGSIKNYYRSGKPVIIRIDKLRKKIDNILNMEIAI